MMRSRFLILWLAVVAATSAIIFAPTAHVSHASTSGVVISAMYGGGSDKGATYDRDYIEIFNAGSVPVNLTNWSVQYRHAREPSSWQKTKLPAVSLVPGQYLLIQQRSGLTRFNPLPTPDASGPADMKRAGQFIVALMSTRRTIVGPDPRLDPNAVNHIQDLFGGGDPSTSVPTVFEGAYRSGTLSVTTAWFRLDHGCQDTDNNLNDFVAADVYPNARNTASPLAPCTAADVKVDISDAPDPVVVGNPVTYTVTASNVGSAGATNTVFTVDLSGSAYPGMITDISQGACSFASPTLTCNIGNLASTGTFVVTFDVTPSVTGLIVTQASISADEPEVGGNNTASGTTTVTAVSVNGIELVGNGGFEDGLNLWVKKGLVDKSKLKCGGAGASSDCAVQIKTGGKLKQTTHMAGVLSQIQSSAGDVIRISATVWSNKSQLKNALIVLVRYNSATAGANSDGRDKFKFTLDPVTMTYTEYVDLKTLADGIYSGTVSIKFSPLSGKSRFDNVSVQLLPIVSGPRSAEISGALPLPSAPASFRGNN